MRARRGALGSGFFAFHADGMNRYREGSVSAWFVAHLGRRFHELFLMKFGTGARFGMIACVNSLYSLPRGNRLFGLQGAGPFRARTFAHEYLFSSLWKPARAALTARPAPNFE